MFDQPSEILFIILMLLTVTIGTAFLVPKLSKDKPKKATDSTFEEYQEMMSTALKDAKAQIRSLQGKINRYGGMEEDSFEDDDLEKPDEMDVLIQAMAAKFNIPQALLNSPDVKAGLKRITKDKTIKSLLPLVASRMQAPVSDPIQAQIAQLQRDGNAV